MSTPPALAAWLFKLLAPQSSLELARERQASIENSSPIPKLPAGVSTSGSDITRLICPQAGVKVMADLSSPSQGGPRSVVLFLGFCWPLVRRCSVYIEFEY